MITLTTLQYVTIIAGCLLAGYSIRAIKEVVDNAQNSIDDK